MLKKVSEIDTTMKELQGQKDQLVTDIENKEVKLNKILEKKKRLENFIDEKVCEGKDTKNRLEREMEEIKAKIEALNKVEAQHPENLKLLDYINNQIEAKAKELECPVCLEVASVPIFRCEELHIICMDCRPKVRKESN